MHIPLAGSECPKKTDHVTIREDQVREVQHDDGISRFCGERLAPLAHILGRESTADGQHDGGAVNGALNLEHRPDCSESNCRSKSKSLNRRTLCRHGADESSGLEKTRTGSPHDSCGRRVRKRLLLILNARIFDSSVDRGIPSRAAAPEGPNRRPPLARRASSTMAFSCAASVPDKPSWRLTAGAADSQLSSTVNSSVSDTMTDRSMTFCSSRTFPGQGYAFSRSSVRLLTRLNLLPAFRPSRPMKYSTSRGMSSRR